MLAGRIRRIQCSVGNQFAYHESQVGYAGGLVKLLWHSNSVFFHLNVEQIQIHEQSEKNITTQSCREVISAICHSVA